MTNVQAHTETERTYDLLDALPNPIYVWRRQADGGVYLVYANDAGHRETEGRVAAALGSELRALYAETQCGPLSKFTNTAELQHVATTLFVTEVSLSL